MSPALPGRETPSNPFDMTYAVGIVVIEPRPSALGDVANYGVMLAGTLKKS